MFLCIWYLFDKYFECSACSFMRVFTVLSIHLVIRINMTLNVEIAHNIIPIDVVLPYGLSCVTLLLTTTTSLFLT